MENRGAPRRGAVFKHGSAAESGDGALSLGCAVAGSVILARVLQGKGES